VRRIHDREVKPIVHIHTASKAPWYDITDGPLQFAEFLPDAVRSEYE
jgi:hypothetical protein